MVRNMGKLKILWFSTAFLAFITALAGVVYPGIYYMVVSTKILPGVLSQDLMTLVASALVLFLVFRMKENDKIKQIVILGILGYLFYGYGIYVIERLYNILYLVYMAIFGLSFYTLIFSITEIRKETLQKVKLPGAIRIISVVFLLFNPLIFYPLWISQLLPLIRFGQKIEFMYSIYILDLCFIMPAFVMLAVMTARNKGLGLVLTPALFVLGFTLLAPLAVGEFLKPLLFHQPMDTAGMWLFLCLSILFLSLAVICCRKLVINSTTS
ncbi:hypothetical protein JXQ31_08845 [candidate division KSB1 bacterium]|nr:hypothetical protein [candidate division KSB1 bacterium]